MDIKNYKLTCLGSPDDERDVLYSDIACADGEVTIPYELDVPYQFGPKNQFKVGSCVAHSLSECEEIVKQANEQFSVGFIYANRSDSDFQGSGMIVREALAHLVKEGNVLNKDFPVNEEYPGIIAFLDKYGKELLFQKATSNKSKGYVRLNVEDIKRYLTVEKKPIIITVKVYDNFYELQTNGGNIPSEPSGKLCGGHCMLIVGFKGDKLKILNSWGNLGDNGYVHLDLSSSIIKELWTLTDEKVVKPPTPTPGPTPVGSILYRVQLGAFKVRAYADELVLELSKKGIDSCVRIYPDLFKVQCGVFKVRDNAVAMQNKLKELGYDCFIVEVK